MQIETAIAHRPGIRAIRYLLEFADRCSGRPRYRKRFELKSQSTEMGRHTKDAVINNPL
jgi:hypothetical protein